MSWIAQTIGFATLGYAAEVYVPLTFVPVKALILSYRSRYHRCYLETYSHVILHFRMVYDWICYEYMKNLLYRLFTSRSTLQLVY